MSNTSPVKQVIRYGLIAILAVALVVLVFDWRARTGAQAAYDKLQAPDLEGSSTSPDDVHKLLNRQPDKPAKEAAGEMVEAYTWKGFRAYTVYVAYSQVIGGGSDGKDSYTMDRVALNQEP
jgi:hypothetical protein